MLYIKNNITEKQLLDYGFNRCKKPYNDCYYLCVSSGCKMIFIGRGIYIFDWVENDPRIHKNVNCKYRSYKTCEDILFELITKSFVEQRIF